MLGVLDRAGDALCAGIALDPDAARRGVDRDRRAAGGVRHDAPPRPHRLCHRDIGFIEGNRTHGQRRSSAGPGSSAAMAAAGLSIGQGVIAPVGDFSFRGGLFEAGEHLFGAHPRGPTAIFASNDDMAWAC